MTETPQASYDVAIIGGGPAGSTVGSVLKKYRPEMKVAIFEREAFPRDHVGESQLPAISDVLEEIGAWDAVEAAGFPIKIGATYRWGQTDELWDFEFLAGTRFVDEPRPAIYQGQRRQTAFQVDRAVYDKILLDHARSLGCDVFESTPVAGVRRSGDLCEGLEVGGCLVTARHYVDASGEGGVLRKTMDVGIAAPTALRNIAFWDYWQDADWAVSLGNGGTRIQVLSLGWGWIWFIPVSPTRTSVGLVVPAEYYKASGKTKEALYLEAVESDPLVSLLLVRARREGPIQGTKDWNFLADRVAGENWFLVGDSGGFADPILSAGMTLAHASGRAAAHTLLALDDGVLPAGWLRSQYDRNLRKQIRQHMMFADFWYTANGRFTDLKAYCREIAAEAGLTLDADEAFRWLSTGGFTDEVPGVARAAGWRLRSLKLIVQHLSGDAATFRVARFNRFFLNLDGATREKLAVYQGGRTFAIDAYRRGNHVLPLAASFLALHHSLQRHSNVHEVLNLSLDIVREMRFFPSGAEAYAQLVDGLETMVVEGWVRGELDSTIPSLSISVPAESEAIHPNRDPIPCKVSAN